MLQLGAANIQNEVHTICISGTEANKLRFVRGLELLRNSDQLARILSILQLREHAELRAMLTAEDFKGVAYDNLRALALAAQLTALEADLNRHLANNTLVNHMHTVCTEANAAEKEALVATLEEMRVGGRLEPILNALRSREHSDLQALLEANSFASNTAYDQLKTDARNAQLIAIQEDPAAKDPPVTGKVR